MYRLGPKKVSLNNEMDDFVGGGVDDYYDDYYDDEYYQE